MVKFNVVSRVLPTWCLDPLGCAANRRVQVIIPYLFFIKILIFRTNLLINVCTSMLCLVRESLLENDFASNMKMLQVCKLICCRCQIQGFNLIAELSWSWYEAYFKQSGTTFSLALARTLNTLWFDYWTLKIFVIGFLIHIKSKNKIHHNKTWYIRVML